MRQNGSSRGQWPAGDGEMARFMRAHDWTQTPLGPMGEWPQSLRAALDICLDSGFASYVWWGPDLIQFYNDCALAIVGDKHPASFAAPAREAWSDVWEVIGGLVDEVIGTGRPVIGEDMPMAPERAGSRQPAWFTFSYSPLRDESGAVAGMFITAIETTGRVRAEQAQRESEERLREMANTAPVLIWETDGEGLTFCNSHYIDFFGVGFEALRGSGWTAFVHPDDVEGYVATFEEAFARRQSYVCEARLRRSDGQYRWVRTVGQPLGEGRMVGGCIDITDLQEAQAALRESEEFKNRIIESTADCIKVLDLEGHLQWISHGGQKALELDDFAQVEGKSWLDIWEGPTRVRAVTAVAAAAAGTASRFSGAASTFKGTHKWWESIITPMLGPDGQPERLLAISRDMSEQRRAIEALLASERRQRALIEGIPQLVWRAAAPGEWSWSSPQWTNYTGLSREESLGNGWMSAVHPDDREAVSSAWEQAGKSHELSIEYRICHTSEKHYRWFHTRAAPVYDAEGAVIEWLGTSTDVDDMRRLQDQQKVILAELQHRARNLLAVVRSIAGRTLGRGRKFDEFSGRLAALSRVQGFLARSDGFTVELGEIVRSELDAHGGDGGGRVRVDGPAIDLPGAKAQPFALALHELATNAVKYGALSTPKGRLTVVWNIEGDQEGERTLALDWRETGVAMGEKNGVTESEHLGYGRELIERALPYQLGAETHLQFTPKGVECSIRVPLAVLAAPKD